MIGLILASCMSMHHCTFKVVEKYNTVEQCEKALPTYPTLPKEFLVCDELK